MAFMFVCMYSAQRDLMFSSLWWCLSGMLHGRHDLFTFPPVLTSFKNIWWLKYLLASLNIISSYIWANNWDISALKPCCTALINVPHLFCSLSSSLSKERLIPRELLNPTKKDPEFRSIFQHIQSAQLCRSPSELFAQHIVSIVHYIKGRVWSVLVLSQQTQDNMTTGVWTVDEIHWTFSFLKYVMCMVLLYVE